MKLETIPAKAITTTENTQSAQQWYILCTGKNQEQKVCSQLGKKGIEHLCPYTYRTEKIVSRTVKAYAPLFPGQVFVYTDAATLSSLTRINGVVNLMYWKSAPAIISREEINAVQMLSENYLSIQTEKTTVNSQEKVRVIEKSISGYQNQVLSIRHQGLTVHLPSLGCKLTAGREQGAAELRPVKLARQKSLAQRLNLFSFLGF